VVLLRNTCQVTAAIHHQFPESPLFKRFDILHSDGAVKFRSEWPAALRTKEADAQADTAVTEAFQESATHNAFHSLLTRHSSLEDALHLQTEKLDLIARQTEQFSPSKSRVARQPPPGHHVESSIAPGPKATTSASAVCAHGHVHACSAVGHGIGMTAACMSPSPPVVARPLAMSHATAMWSTPQLGGMQMPPHPQVIPTAPLGPPGPYLLPLVVSHLGSVYHVLPLSPGPLPPRTFADLIIPDPIAFCDIMSTSPPSYPPFTAMNCLWQVMFTHIRQPQHLWSCWGPKNLGDYPSIEMLWQAWDEGSFVSEVGHQPPLRLVEKQWGHQEDQRTGKGQLQVWRPHKDNTVMFSLWQIH
jgi:hypothetical protein